MVSIGIITLALLSISDANTNDHSNRNSGTPKEFNLSNYKGKIVYLDFWASWCIPCRKSFPWMNKIQEQYEDQEFKIVTINLDKEKDLALDFLKSYPANFEIFYDPKGIIAKKYAIKGMPSSILFDKKGKIVSVHTGFFSKKVTHYEQEIEQLVRTQLNLRQEE